MPVNLDNVLTPEVIGQLAVSFALLLVFLGYVLNWRRKNLPEARWFDLGPFNIFFYSLPAMTAVFFFVAVYGHTRPANSEPAAIDTERALRQRYFETPKPEDVRPLFQWLHYIDSVSLRSIAEDYESRGLWEENRRHILDGLIDKALGSNSTIDSAKAAIIYEFTGQTAYFGEKYWLESYRPAIQDEATLLVNIIYGVNADTTGYLSSLFNSQGKRDSLSSFLRSGVRSLAFSEIFKYLQDKEDAGAMAFILDNRNGYTITPARLHVLLRGAVKLKSTGLYLRLLGPLIKTQVSLTALIFSLLQILLWAIYIFRLAPVRKKDAWLMSAGFTAGMVSVFPALIFGYYLDAYFMQMGIPEWQSIFIVAGLGEEICKDIFLIAAILILPRMRAMEVLRLAIFIALGFSFLENTFYFNSSYSFSLITLRSILTTSSHIFYAGLIVYSYIFYRDTAARSTLIFRMAGALLVAAFVHGLQDALLITNKSIIALVFVWGPSIYIMSRVLNGVLNIDAAETGETEPLLPQKLSAILITGFLLTYLLDLIFDSGIKSGTDTITQFAVSLPSYALLMLFTSLRLSSIIVLPGVKINLLETRSNTYRDYFRHTISREFSVLFPPAPGRDFGVVYRVQVINTHTYKEYSDYLEIKIPHAGLSFQDDCEVEKKVSLAILQTERYGDLPGREDVEIKAKLWAIPALTAGYRSLKQILSTSHVEVTILPE